MGSPFATRSASTPLGRGPSFAESFVPECLRRCPLGDGVREAQQLREGPFEADQKIRDESPSMARCSLPALAAACPRGR